MRSRGRFRACLALVFGCAAALAGCSSDFGQHAPVTKQGRSMSDLWRGGVMTALAVGAIVLSLILFVVFRYRRRGHDDVPSQRQYNLGLEIVYTALPIVIVLVLFGFSYVVQDKVDALSDDPDVTIEVEGFQWQWQFHYEDEDITVTGVPDHRPVMVLPVGETVRLVLDSHDVAHSFYVPEFLFKRDVIPALTNRFDIEVEKAGTYKGFCAEFCGLDHARMTFTVRAVSRAEYDQWVEEQQS
jgi:cytochrome c oxidase subunit 2